MNRGIRPRVYIGLIVFILAMISLIFLGVLLQREYKMWGMALTEIILLAWAIIPAIILKWDLKEVFPMQIPSWRQVFGSLVLWFGGYIAVIAVTTVIAYFFSEGMIDLSSAMTEFFSSVSFPVRFFILTVMPAVCEEALHRGFILHSFKNTGKWTAILSLGLIFGIFHLDFYRFAGTAILGLVFTYVMVETRNILLPMLLHFVNNSLSALSTLSAAPSPEVVEIPLASVGIWLFIASAVPFLLLAGSRLLKPREEARAKPIAKGAWAIVIILAVVLALAGVTATAIGSAELLADIKDMITEPVYQLSFSQHVDKETPGHQQEFSVENAKTHFLLLSIEGEEGVITQVSIINSQSGEEVYCAIVQEMSLQGSIYLSEGDYTVIVSFFTGSVEPIPVSVDILLR